MKALGLVMVVLNGVDGIKKMTTMVMIAVPTLVYTACPHIKLFVHDHKPPIKVPRIEV